MDTHEVFPCAIVSKGLPLEMVYSGRTVSEKPILISRALYTLGNGFSDSWKKSKI